jgi:hexosaminidase
MKIKPPIAVIFLGVTLAATSVFAAETSGPAIIPLPQKMELRDGAFQINADTRVYVDSGSRATGNFLTQRLRPATGYPLKTSTKYFGSAAIPGGILLTTKNAETNLGPEGYELTVASNSVVIRAPTQAGLFYGVQTLFQLLPPEIYSSNRVDNVAWEIPCVQIEDWPRFKWRGFMLDVSRHFFDKAEVETILDAMALHKLNMFHWHLTDDQGWRIEIKKYPKLTQIGAWRAGVGFKLDPKSTTKYDAAGRYGGFYTPDDIREVVAYAAARHITIVPEIEMPGHSMAALAAYPEFSSNGKITIPTDDGGVLNGIYNPANPGTFTFLENVLTEVFQLFPGKYIHIGGDEVPPDAWKNNSECQALMKREGLKNQAELQSWFTRRIEKFVSAHGRTMIGWSEILKGGIAQNAVVMDWIGGATEAAQAGHDVVMSPAHYCYFDFYQTTNFSNEPPAQNWAGALPLNKVYSFEPVPADLAPQLQAHILGAQGNLWTEKIPNLKHAEYMIFPRECAIAEITWSSKSSRDWDDFMRRLQVHVRRLDELNINYRHAAVETPEPSLLK